MTTNSITDNDTFTYEAPSLQVVGSLQDITKAGKEKNGDVTNGKNNAYPPGS